MVSAPFRYLVVVAVLLFGYTVVGQSNALVEAREALTSGNPSEKISLLDSLTKTNTLSPTLYQALGNAHHDRGEYGKAILAYERGLRLQPANKDLANNLKYVRGEAGIDRPIIKEFFGVRWWRSFGAWVGVAAAKWIALLCWSLAVAGAALWYLRREQMAETRRFALLPASGVLLALAFVFYVLGSSRAAYLGNDRDAILTARSAELRVAPGPDATLEETLTEGLKVRILDEFESYVKVSLENGRQGWLRSDVVDII
ncbi:tetratricopeptide repeat protein [Lewinella sp. 4G2]|uniref:tetratricopeptide repeat protein n=1 Tax=Lewinella sp. 4G2 TaxID=1803372 RepID=UPI0007B4D957|nr:tetratricopeptide repeat protein [Lewinella sp. 4G2]OAV42886.1 hypothetical protein A3850_016815 [Lewinella sp. 4G2]